LNEYREKLLQSFLFFTQVFYKLRTGREFQLSTPIGRESHYITIARSLTDVFKGKIKRLIINVPPRYGKTELVIHWIAWVMAHYPDSNFIYTSYSHTLAKKQTQTVRQIITMPEYRKLFCVELSSDTSAKDNFETTRGGSVYGVGAGGTITGRGAGIQGVNNIGGAIVIDDIHKPSEVTSDTIRASDNEWYLNTLQSRVNSPLTPIIGIGQCLHEDDLWANLKKGFDGHEWTVVSLPALDPAKNALLPSMHDVAALIKMQETMPYEFASQYQQDPQPAGGGIYKPEWLVQLDEYPEMLATFITVDAAESIQQYADYTVFTFLGLHKLVHKNIDIGLYGLHIIDCLQERIEPKDIEAEFMAFWMKCMTFPGKKPHIAAIEKKSTGSTLCSIMKNVQGLRIIEIERNDRQVGIKGKTYRFLHAQPIIANKQISLPFEAKHTKMVIEHMRKITANETHAHDDICDTIADGIKLALIDRVIYREEEDKIASQAVMKNIISHHNKLQNARTKAWYK